MKKFIYGMLSVAMASMLMLGCGGDGGKKTAAPAAPADKKVVVKVGATPVPHAELLNFVKPQPNLSLSDKELDANFFQHIPFLEKTCQERNLKLVVLDKIHIEPMGCYSKKYKDIKSLPNGAKVAIPNDPTNGGRSLMLLEAAGLLKLKDGKGITATPNDLAANPKNLKIIEVESATLPRALDDTDLAVINSNFAMEAKLNPVKDSLFIEKDSPYANVIAVRTGDEKRPELVKLAKALKTPEVKKFIQDKYKGAVVPAF